MTQNGLKWILNITFKTVKFFWFDPSPPNSEKFHGFFFFLMKASLIDKPEAKSKSKVQAPNP